MSPVFTAEGVRTLRASWLLLAASVVAGATLVAATHWYLAKEEADGRVSDRRLQEARARVDGARRELQSLDASAEKFRALVDRGLLQPERRLELVERVHELRERHQLFAVDYEIAPQRSLALGPGAAYPAIEILASRVKLKARALHEGDVLTFLEALRETPRGFYPLDRCVLRRLDVPSADALQPRVEAECTLEWVTLRERRAG